jgi:hypothetical protein
MSGRFDDDCIRCDYEYTARQQRGEISIDRQKPVSNLIKVHIILGWDDFSDLDLHVRGPDGEIYYSNPKGVGHFLLLDENVQPKTEKPVEDHYFTKDCPDGMYEIMVNNYNLRKGKFTPFVVHMTIYNDGRPNDPVSFETTEAAGIGHKQKITVGKVYIESGAPRLEIIEPKLLTAETSSGVVERNAPAPAAILRTKRICRQREGYSGVAIYQNKTDPNPIAELINGRRIFVDAEDDIWYTFTANIRGTTGTFHLKKHNTVPDQTSPVEDVVIDERH